MAPVFPQNDSLWIFWNNDEQRTKVFVNLSVAIPRNPTTNNVVEPLSGESLLVGVPK